MKMKSLNLVLTAFIFAMAAGTPLLLTGCKDKGGSAPADNAGNQDTLYTCGMHPQILQNKPGNCPICGMKLTPVRKQPAGTQAGPRKAQFYKSTMNPGETSASPGKDSMGMDMVPVFEDQASNANVISIDPVTVQNMGIRTEAVASGPVHRIVRTVGAVDFDETTLADVTTKYRGWIEKLYVNATGQPVHRGDPLFEIYAPELYGAQAEYVAALNATNIGGENLKTAARNKLRFYDVSEEQIAELDNTRQVKRTLRVPAPRDGVVVEKLAVQGQMVEAGMKLYRLADLSVVWAQTEVFEQDLPLVSLGQEATVTLSYLPGRQFRGRVAYIYPTIDDKTRAARLRVELPNPDGFLKPGMFATVELDALLAPSAVLVPDSAVLRSGVRNTVFVALDKGRFEPRTIALGVRSADNRYQVLSGLQPGEKVVVSGQFMLDSESQLREAILKMTKPAEEAAPANASASQRTAAPSAALYTCPMEAHADVVSDQPGQCPKCGMTLVATSTVAHGKIAEQHWADKLAGRSGGQR